MITPNLKLTTNVNVVLLIFDKNFQDLFEIIEKVLLIEIIGLGPLDFIHRVSPTEEQNTFQIQFNFNVSSTKTPNLTVTFLQPLKIVNHPVNRLTKSKLSIRMRSFFDTGLTSQEDLERSKKTVDECSNIATATSVLSSFFTTGSTIAFKSLLLMDSLKFLR